MPGMGYSFEFDTATVQAFVVERLPGLRSLQGVRAIGLRLRGELVAGVLFEGVNANNCWMHVAAKPGARWCIHAYVRACFGYAFNGCGVQRVSAHVNESNTAARRLDEHLGFEVEARLKGAAHDGGDVLIYRMWKKDCKYVALA